MKELLAVLAGFLVLAGAASLAVGTFGDRDLFVPPPDAVAEGFIRETLTGRYARAKHALREPESVSEQDLCDFEKRIEADVKEASEIEASVVSRDDERALVTVRISSTEGCMLPPAHSGLIANGRSQDSGNIDGWKDVWMGDFRPKISELPAALSMVVGF